MRLRMRKKVTAKIKELDYFFGWIFLTFKIYFNKTIFVLNFDPPTFRMVNYFFGEHNAKS